MRGLQHGGKAALIRDIAAQIVGGALGQPDRIGLQSAGGKLRRHDRDIQLLAQLDVVVDVLVRHRIFVPVVAHLLDRTADAQRIGVAVAPGGIEHQPEVIAHRLANRRAYLDVLIRIARRMDLVGAPAVCLERLRLIDIGRDVGQHLRARIGKDRSAACAHQRVYRQLGDLAAQIPQCSVHRPDRAVADNARHQSHGAVDALALQRVLPHQHRLERPDKLRSVHRRGIGRGTQKRVAFQSLVCVDAQQAEIAGGRGQRAKVIARRRDAVPRDDGQRYVVDLHVLQTPMRPVATGLVAAVLAAAERDLAGFLRLELDRREAAALV